MKKSEKQKLIANNAAIWAVGMLASFVLPLIADSLTEGRGNFLRMMMHIAPLIAAMAISSALISKTIGDPTE